MTDRVGTILTVDYAALERDLDAVGRVALPRAAAGMLNGAAFAAQRRLTGSVDEVFDRPKPFTRNAFLVQRAKRSDRANMSSAVFAKDRQAAFLRLQIEGGKRGPADVGISGRADVMTHAVRTDRFGGIPRGFIGKLSAERAKEKAARTAFASRRSAAVEAHQSDLQLQRGRVANARAARDRASVRAEAAELTAAFGGNARAAGRAERSRRSSDAAGRKLARLRARLSATTAPSYEREHSPGIFFATVKGVRGYWRRPKRTAPSGPRRKGVRQVRNSGKLALLLRVQDHAVYKPRFPYNQIIADSYAEYGAPAEFSRELDRAVRIEMEKASRSGSRRSTSGPGWRRPAFLAGR